MKRAQATVETLIVIAAAILILVTVSLSLSFSSSRTAKDVQHFSDARFAVDRIATAASSTTNSYDSRSVELYLPGFTSAGIGGGEPLIQRSTRIYINSNQSLIAVVSSLRRGDNGSVELNDTRTIERELPGEGWVLVNSTGDNEIVEGRGASYALNISRGRISFARQ